MVQNIIFWPLYSQLGSKSRPLLVVQRITCTSFNTMFQYNDICTYMYQFWYCFQYKYMVQNIIFWPVYSQLGSKSRPLLVRNFGLCTSQIVVYDPKLRYRVGPPFLHALPKLTWWLLSVLYFLQMFLDRFIDHVLLIPWLCAGLLGGKSGVRCATILTVTRSQKTREISNLAVPVLYGVSI